MIRLKNIRNEKGIVSCVAFVEDCEQGVSVVYDVEKDVLTHEDLTEEYAWCSSYFSYARRELKRMAGSGVFRESATVMWY